VRTHYYFGWFNDTMPKEIGMLLNEDLSSKASLVMICTTPSEYESNDQMSKWVRESWFDFAGVTFNDYHVIDDRVTKDEAQTLLRNASAIFLHGGYPDRLNCFLEEYELSEAVKVSKATVVMGASAGGMNMCAKFIYGKYIDDEHREPGRLYNGLGLDDFALQSHAPLGDVESVAQNEHARKYLIPLSESIDVYVACEESTIRIKNDKLDVLGEVYLIANGEIQKMPETDFSKLTSN